MNHASVIHPFRGVAGQFPIASTPGPYLCHFKFFFNTYFQLPQHQVSGTTKLAELDSLLESGLMNDSPWWQVPLVRPLETSFYTRQGA